MYIILCYIPDSLHKLQHKLKQMMIISNLHPCISRAIDKAINDVGGHHFESKALHNLITTNNSKTNFK